MVKSTQNISGNDATAALDGPAVRRVFAQSEMGSRGIIVKGISAQDSVQMCLVAHDHVVEAFASD
jgi:hypothetical protein